MARKKDDEVTKSTVDVAGGTAKTPRKKATAKPKSTAVTISAPDRRPVDGDRVTVEYIGTFPNGQVFDKATPEEPFVFTVGAGQVLPKFEAMVKGMTPGITNTFTVHMIEAYGPYREQMVITVPRDSFPSGDALQVGKRASVADDQGNREVMKVVEITDTTVKLDGNHPLAGQSLTFHNVKITAID